MAEEYGVTDLEGLPVKLLATLVSGLREDSRYKLKRNGILPMAEHVLLARIADELSVLRYSLAGCKGKKPELLTDLLFGKEEDHKKKETARVYKSREDFMRARYGGKKWHQE